MLNYEEIESFYYKGSLAVMKNKLKLSWEDLFETLFKHIECMQEELDSAETELANAEDRDGMIEELNHTIEVLQDEISEYKDENLRMKDVIGDLESHKDYLESFR